MDAAKVLRRAPFGDNPKVGARGAVTQRRILEAALGVFAEHGFHGTRVELITEAAGCSRPAFYQYFSNQNDVFWHLARQFAAELREVGDALGEVGPDRGGVDDLGSWLDQLIDVQNRFAPVYSVFQAAARGEEPTRRTSHGIAERMGDAVLEAGGVRPGLEVHALASITTTVVQRSIYYWRTGLSRLPRDRFVMGLAETIHRLLHGPVEGVNVGPVVQAPPKRTLRWPAFPGMAEHDPELQPRGQRTRQKLLDAGSHVLPRRGYHDTRVDDIVEEAGVSHGSFYRYFRNKDDLFHVLAEQAAAAMIGLVESFPSEPDPVVVRIWLHGWFATYRRNGGVISAWQEIDYDDPELADFSLNVASVMTDRLTRIVHRRGFGDVQADGVALLAVIERVPYSVLALGFLDEDDAVDAAAHFVCRALLGITR